MKSGRFYSSLLLALAFMTLASGILLACVRHEHRSQFRAMQSRIGERDGLEVEWGALQLERATWAGYGRIDREASERLRMRRPKPDDIVFLRVASTDSALQDPGTGSR